MAATQDQHKPKPIHMRVDDEVRGLVQRMAVDDKLTVTSFITRLILREAEARGLRKASHAA